MNLIVTSEYKTHEDRHDFLLDPHFIAVTTVLLDETATLPSHWAAMDCRGAESKSCIAVSSVREVVDHGDAGQDDMNEEADDGEHHKNSEYLYSLLSWKRPHPQS